MNYLAHSLLSFNIEPIVVGNFIADHIKLADTEDLPEMVRKGVIIHRKIDYFTDTHPLFIKGKRVFYNGYERYSGVLMDIYYDYLLAKNFNAFSQMDLKEYTKNVYTILQNNKRYLPESSSRFLDYVLKNDTFFEYSKIEGIELVLKHLSYRINHGVALNESVPIFLDNIDKLEIDFVDFMGDLINEIKRELK